MNLPPDHDGFADSALSDGHAAGPATPLAALFDGDTGTLPEDARNVLVNLLLGPAIDAKRQSKLWPVLLRDEAPIRSVLHNLYLELIVDRDQKVAFTRQVKSDERDFPILLRKASFNFLESALMLYLRQRLLEGDTGIDRTVVAGQEMREHLMVFERADSSDRSGFQSRVDTAIEKAKKVGVLSVLRGTDRYEVSPTLKLLFTADHIQQLAREYAKIGAADSDPVDEDGDAVVAGAGDQAP